MTLKAEKYDAEEKVKRLDYGIYSQSLSHTHYFFSHTFSVLLLYLSLSVPFLSLVTSFSFSCAFPPLLYYLF